MTLFPHLLAFVRDGAGLTPAESWAAIGVACVLQALVIMVIWHWLNALEDDRQGARR